MREEIKGAKLTTRELLTHYSASVSPQEGRERFSKEYIPSPLRTRQELPHTCSNI